MNKIIEALKGIVQCCDGNEPKHEQIYHIANDAIKEAEAEQLILSGVVKSLKNKEAISFKEWIKLNKHTDTYNDFLEGGFTYTLGDLYREYSKDETNL